MKKFFSKFACLAASGLGSAYAFLFAVVGVLVWAATGPAFGFSETWQLVINTSTTIITFLSVFLIQNSQNRESKAMQLKLDELIRTLEEARNDMIDLEDKSDEELDALGKQFKTYCGGNGQKACSDPEMKTHSCSSKEPESKEEKVPFKRVSPTAIEDHSLSWMPKSVWGPIKWKELHSRALADFSMREEEHWFEEFLDGLPCPECRTDFETFLKKNPPVFDTHENFFKWTVEAHNYVNRKLGKKEISLEAARKLHQYEKDAEPAGSGR